ncbi:cytochrome c oxidase copper chaperone 1-like [Euphorbia lathyris]|uniref:cytochrome c oxidase copper chaperone 1-like n=1 Tax=Euphorbia lathyris TaxID=212925 RepID=UPI0033143C50
MGGLPLQNASPSPLALPGSEQNKGSVTTSIPEPKPKKKICCACPDTKRLRDECIVEHGEDACSKWIEAHRQCLRSEGFNV